MRQYDQRLCDRGVAPRGVSHFFRNETPQGNKFEDRLVSRLRRHGVHAF